MWYGLYAYIEQEWVLINTFSSLEEAHYEGTQCNPFMWKIEIEED